MANARLSRAKVILLAVHSAINSDIYQLRSLVFQYPEALRTDIILRVLLTYLPETLKASEYITFLKEIASGSIGEDLSAQIDVSALDEISEAIAGRKVKKLHLLTLLWPGAPADAPDDSLTRFLIHRSYRIDEETGLIDQVPELIGPFTQRSEFLRTWAISTLLPLLRFNYEYYPQEISTQTIESFEALDDTAGVNLLLSKTGEDAEWERNNQGTVGRDLRGLICPWMYGNNRWKRRKLRESIETKAQIVAPLDEKLAPDIDELSSWEEVFKWLVSRATESWPLCVQAIEQWDGPGDIDLGDYGSGKTWLDERQQQHLERRYARAILASAYLISEPSVDALNGIQRILTRIITLLDLDRIPTLTAAAALLSPVPVLHESGLLSSEHATSLRSGLMSENNPLTAPKAVSLTLLHSLLLSAFLLTRAGLPCTIRRAGELVLLQDEREQTVEFHKLVEKVANGPKGDDKYWVRTRNELLWLRDWGLEYANENIGFPAGRGIFGQVKKELLEMEILKTLLSNTRYTLAQSIYETTSTPPLSKEELQDTIISAAMFAYDNATNANRTRGGVKKCDDIIRAFPGTLRGVVAYNRIQHLLSLTHSIGSYRLVLKQGEPFAPVNLRVHEDPLSIIGKVIEQNPKSYTKINDLVYMGEEMVMAGLTIRDVEGSKAVEERQLVDHILIARRRVTSMCIDGALAEDDFETAYSYVMTRLSSLASEPDIRHSSTELSAKPTAKVADDWSWKAALQAGKYRSNINSVKPTHLGNASGNLEIRHLEQRMECLSQALRIAPPTTLQEILNVYRRCEEELDAKVQQEADQEAAWDNEGDEKVMPGGFAADPRVSLSRPGATISTAAARTGDGAPMSLFDLTRASALQARHTLSALTTLQGGGKKESGSQRSQTTEQIARSQGVEPSRVRKRDQLRNAAVGTLASGVGWLIGAQPIMHQEEQNDEE